MKDWPLFCCPHCEKRFPKDDARFAVVKLPEEVSDGLLEGGVLGVAASVVPCPDCGKELELVKIHTGKYDNPRLTAGTLVKWAAISGGVLVAARILLSIAEKRAFPS